MPAAEAASTVLDRSKRQLEIGSVGRQGACGRLRRADRCLPLRVTATRRYQAENSQTVQSSSVIEREQAARSSVDQSD